MKSKQVLLSPRNYIIQRAQNLPIIECLVEANYKNLGITNVAIIRKEPGGKYTLGVFCVDLFCLGVKNAFCNCHLDEEAFERIFKSFREPMQVSPTLAHNLIYGSIDYAEELNFTPHKDFAFAEHVLDPTLVDEGINEIEFGKNGKPFYCAGPHDNKNQIIAHLNKYVGIGNYDYIVEVDHNF